MGDLVRSLKAEIHKKDTELALFRAQAIKEDKTPRPTNNQAAADQAKKIKTNSAADSGRGEAQQFPRQNQALPKVYDNANEALASARRGLQQDRGQGREDVQSPSVHHPR